MKVQLKTRNSESGFGCKAAVWIRRAWPEAHRTSHRICSTWHNISAYKSGEGEEGRVSFSRHCSRRGKGRGFLPPLQVTMGGRRRRHKTEEGGMEGEREAQRDKKRGRKKEKESDGSEGEGRRGDLGISCSFNTWLISSKSLSNTAGPESTEPSSWYWRITSTAGGQRVTNEIRADEPFTLTSCHRGQSEPLPLTFSCNP